MDNLRDHFTFIVEWFDSESSTIRKFLLNFYEQDCCVEMIDVKKNKIFLRRTQCEDLYMKDLFIGNSIKLFSRILKITDYADVYTKNIGSSSTYECSIGFLRPHTGDKKSEVFQEIINHGLEIVNLIMVEMNEEIKRGLTHYLSSARSPLSCMLSGSILIFQLRSKNAIDKLMDIVGPDCREEALNNNPHCLRARYSNLDSNYLFLANKENINELTNLFFPVGEPRVRIKPYCLLENTTLCIIKPHALREGNMANIVQLIEDNGFEITGVRMLLMNHTNAVTLLEVYQGVVNEYPGYVSQLTSGRCLALEIKGAMGSNTVEEFRNLAGPSDVEIAKTLRPHTIRAKFGKNNVENAVHVTDLEEDAYFEVEFMFRIVQD